MSSKSINVEYIKVTAAAGAPVFRCVRDAIVLSMKKGCDVMLVHNDIEYHIPFLKTIDSVSLNIK